MNTAGQFNECQKGTMPDVPGMSVIEDSGNCMALFRCTQSVLWPKPAR